MKSKTKIEEQLERKNNPELAKTIILAKKNSGWLEAARILSGPRKSRINLNLDEINKEAKEGEKVVVLGKVLSQGKIEKKIKIIALNFSERAKEKILKEHCEFSTILEEIKRNPNAEKLRFLK
jgi:large subunit ribosomal protein L18e